MAIDPNIGIPIGQRLVEPVLGLEHVVLSEAIDDAVSMVGFVQIDDVVGHQVHGAVELAQGLVVKAPHPIEALPKASVVYVGSEKARYGIEILAVDGEGVAQRQLLDGVAIDEALKVVHESA